ncbi:hypothetical protein BU16DRAFT_536151 [Lophium mytilinum]|uniref:Uncharacterized protein n=1 Tax=Lophium mytilinum TaxID=390894 RepID=A0A6A6R5W6_9PEZI|nr:hypothetical protein BU16DRAFT_536151 [Lophium mytilinum]
MYSSTLVALLCSLISSTLSSPSSPPQPVEPFDSYAITNCTTHVSLAYYKQSPEYAPSDPTWYQKLIDNKGRLPKVEGHTLQADKYSIAAFNQSGFRMSIDNVGWAPHDGSLPVPPYGYGVDNKGWLMCYMANGLELFQEKDGEKETCYARYYCYRF